MASAVPRPMTLGWIGALALIIMVSVPAYGAYERGPVKLVFDNPTCAGTPLYVHQQVPNATLDLGLTTCTNISTSEALYSARHSCENGIFRLAVYYTDTCEGFGYSEANRVNLCFPGTEGAKRDVELPGVLEALFASEAPKRVPGDASTVYLCNPGESWTLVANTPLNTSEPVLATLDTVDCFAPGNCTNGTAHVSVHNSTDRPAQTCDEPIYSVEYFGGAVMGQCYWHDTYNMLAFCSSEDVGIDYHPYGCGAPWTRRQAYIFPADAEQCSSVQGQDLSFFCSPSLLQPTSPSIPPVASASRQSPLFLFFLSITLIASVAGL